MARRSELRVPCPTARWHLGPALRDGASVPDEKSPLQFDKAEFGATGAAVPSACAVCNKPLRDRYFTLNAATVCAQCAGLVRDHHARPPDAQSVAQAIAQGLLFGLGGSLAWYLVERFVGGAWGLIAILVGWLVGRGVSQASGGRGGPVFQVLAGAITYACICFASLPAAYEATRGDLVAALSIALVGPVTRGLSLTQLIIGFGIFEAVRINKKPAISVAGPFELPGPGANRAP